MKSGQKRIICISMCIFTAAILFLIVWTTVSGIDVVVRVITFGDTQIDDYRHHSGRWLSGSTNPSTLNSQYQANNMGDPLPVPGDNKIQLESILDDTQTTAFIILSEGKLVYEYYQETVKKSDIFQGFSISKSILSLLIGAAIDEGRIKSIHQSVTEFIPEMKDPLFSEVTILDLLLMRSGIKYTENDNIFVEHVRFNYSADLRSEILNLKVKRNPEKVFEYKSCDNALLALILEKAVFPMSLTEYLQIKIWDPLGMEYDGFWGTDSRKHGFERSWCCLSAAPVDYAKIGQLMLNEGKWMGESIISEQWIRDSVTGQYSEFGLQHTLGDSRFENYGYQWWIASQERGDFLAIGKDGQFIYVDPENAVVIVRNGWHCSGKKVPLSFGDWLELFQELSDRLQ